MHTKPLFFSTASEIFTISCSHYEPPVIPPKFFFNSSYWRCFLRFYRRPLSSRDDHPWIRHFYISHSYHSVTIDFYYFCVTLLCYIVHCASCTHLSSLTILECLLPVFSLMTVFRTLFSPPSIQPSFLLLCWPFAYAISAAHTNSFILMHQSNFDHVLFSLCLPVFFLRCFMISLFNKLFLVPKSLIYVVTQHSGTLIAFSTL